MSESQVGASRPQAHLAPLSPPTPEPGPQAALGNVQRGFWLTQCGRPSAGGATGIEWVETREATEHQGCAQHCPQQGVTQPPMARVLRSRKSAPGLLFIEQILRSIWPDSQHCEFRPARLLP